MTKISRRTVLRAAGATIALPWLESLPVFAADAARANEVPKRFAVLFMGNGISGNHWWAQGRGSGMMLGRSLRPLEPLKRKINVINGLFNEPAVGNGIHPAQTGNLLSGARLREHPLVHAGISIDQLIAERIGRETPLPLLVLSCEPPVAGRHETDFSLVYSSHISWRSADSPSPIDVKPARAFDRLFARRPTVGCASVLDQVTRRAKRLTRSVSAFDKTRLDEYLTNVRELETRVDRVRGRPPGDIREHARLMCDIIALAFQTDRTRVVSLILARDLSSLSYAFLGVGGDHHLASHDDLSDDYEAIARFHVSQLAYLAGRLDAMPEGDGTVLDNCCLLWLSNMWSGWKHDNRKLPVVTAGGLGGTLETGRALEYLYSGDEQRKLCSLYLSIADRMGVTLDRFGDSNTRLEGF